MTKSSASSPVVDQENESPSGSVAVYVPTVSVFSGTDCDASPVITGGSFTLVTVTVTGWVPGRPPLSVAVTVTWYSLLPPASEGFS